VDGPFLGSEALTCGALNRHQLRTRYRVLLPNVYLPCRVQPSLRQRIVGAWLWSDRAGIIAGEAAAAVHGAEWIPDDVPIEVICASSRAPDGVVTRRDALTDGETQVVDCFTVTTPARTAFDVGRRLDRRPAVARLDSLLRATGVNVDDVLRVADQHPGARGLRRLETALELVDPGAQSPQETYLRLVLVDAGLPRPQSQVPVVGRDGVPIAYLDLGWPEHMVAVEYDGDQHRTERVQYVKDIRRIELLERMGWIVIRVVYEDRPADIVRRVRAALDARASSVR
jgi:hypothetical protein